MEDAELEAVKIQKMGGGKSHSRYPHSKSQYPPPPGPTLGLVISHVAKENT